MTTRHRSSQSRHEEADETITDAQQEATTPSYAPRPVARQTMQEADRIGDILRRVREHRRERLEDISEYLRIRPTYLFALENSRYEDLPADAYVIGFLRTYAAYLGLDGKGAIDQYRREMAGRRRKPQLAMPQPMSEGRAPSALVMVGAAIAALVLYGVWYGLSSPDKEALEKPVELPQVTQEAPASNAIAGQTATSDGIALPVSSASTVVPATLPMEAGKAASATPVEAAPALPSTQTPAAAPPQPVTETTAPAPKDKGDKPKDKEQEKAKDKDAAKKDDKVKDAPKTEAQPATAKPVDKQSSQLTIKADKESWVLVTDSKGNTVFDKTLKAGETYNVPSGKGLRLTTSNANGVSFTMDGKAMPKLKSSEPVVRAMPLDPDKLGGQGDEATPPPSTTPTDEQE